MLMIRYDNKKDNNKIRKLLEKYSIKNYEYIKNKYYLCEQIVIIHRFIGDLTDFINEVKENNILIYDCEKL